MTLEQNIDGAHFQVGLPAKFELEKIVEKRLEVVDQVLVCHGDTSCAALRECLLNIIKGKVHARVKSVALGRSKQLAHLTNVV